MGQRYHSQEPDDDVPPARWETFITWVLIGYGCLWVISLLSEIGSQVKHDASASTSGAQWNAGLCVLGLMALTTHLVRRRGLLRVKWKLLLMIGIYAWIIASLYDNVARALAVPWIPNLDQISPGLVHAGTNVLPLVSGFITLTYLAYSSRRSSTPPPTT